MSVARLTLGALLAACCALPVAAQDGGAQDGAGDAPTEALKAPAAEDDAPPSLLDQTKPMSDCLPAAIHDSFPHGLSEAPNCLYDPPHGCDQEFDVGVWQANGALGQLIIGHPGLDMLVVTRDLTLYGAEGFFTFGLAFALLLGECRLIDAVRERILQKKRSESVPE